MSEKPENPQAFASHGSMGEVVQEGMTLRDYFAAKAMQAFISSIEELDSNSKIKHETIANDAFKMADAMLKERDASS